MVGRTWRLVGGAPTLAVAAVAVLAASAGPAPAQSLLGYAPRQTPSQSYVVGLQTHYRLAAKMGPWHVLGPMDPNVQSLTPGAVDLGRPQVGQAGSPLAWVPLPVDVVLDRPHFVNSNDAWRYDAGVRAFVNRFLVGKDRRPGRAYFCRTLAASVAQKHRGVVYSSRGLDATVWINGKLVRQRKDDTFDFTMDLREGDNELLVRLDATTGKGVQSEFGFECNELQFESYVTTPLEERIVRDFPAESPDAVREFCRLSQQIAEKAVGGEAYRQRQELLASQSLRPDALILPGDRDGLDVVLRRTRSLLADLAGRPGGPPAAGYSAELAEIDRARQGMGVDDPAWWGLFARACAARRRIALSNPLLSFERIVLLKRHPTSFGHMCDQYFGFTAVPGGGLFVLDKPFSDHPMARDLLAEATVQNGRLKGRKLEGGSFLSLELSYDGRTLLFAWTQRSTAERTWTPDNTYHIFRVNVDPSAGSGLRGSALTQLTDGNCNDFDPCLLPSGRIMFVSERRGGFGRCHGRAVPVYTLFGMAADGGDIIPLSYHETNEWNPSVDHDGMVVYCRWDYIDRDDETQSLWTTYPDGRDPRSPHGNYPIVRESRPWAEMAPRAVPGSQKLLAVASAHHGAAFGSLVLVDRSVEDDHAMSQVRRFTPDVPMPESESGDSLCNAFATPWPVGEDYCLTAYSPHAQRHGVYLVDSFGNRLLIYEDPQIACSDPIPLCPRPTPPVIPVQTLQARADREGGVSAPATGTAAVTNVYDSDFPWPDGTKIAALRIVQLFPKTTINGDQPRIGAGSQALARGVIGTVPVEADGSAHFEVKAGACIYFQALDERGLAVQSMRSGTYVHPGEQLTCQGCHEPKPRVHGQAPQAAAPLAMRRAASKVQPDVEGSWPLTFPRLVQPALDRNCVPCHSREKGAPGLTGRLVGAEPKSEAWLTLHSRVWYCAGGNGSINNPPDRGGGSRSIAGQVGARASKLFQMFEKGHHGVKLPAEDFHRLTLWMDCNANFYGVYHDVEKQARGERVLPTLE